MFRWLCTLRSEPKTSCNLCLNIIETSIASTPKMAKDVIYYDILGVAPTATDIELKKAYRKQAIKLHPDKNTDDPHASSKFQELGEAYNVLQNPETRALYDEVGVEGLKLTGADQTGVDLDVGDFFKMVFGGECFDSWIGELTMFTEITKTAEVMNEEHFNQPHGETQGESDIQAITNGDHIASDKSSQSNSKAQLQKERREKLLALQEESKRAMDVRIAELSATLINRITQFEEATTPDSMKRFISKLRLELENLKLESFGLQLVHLIGNTYITQANATIHSLRTFGVSKLITSTKRKTDRMKGGILIVKSVLDAQASAEKIMNDTSFAEVDVTDLTDGERERQMEAERVITGKFLAIAWASTKFEVSGILNKVTNKVLNDKNLNKKERSARAKALIFIGKEMLATKRTPEEEEEAQIFEELMADASTKKSKHGRK